jgi:hypothetical protein
VDDESKQLLRQLVDAQREQTELLRKHALPMWTRIRFSLLALFVLMTLMATGVGFTVWAIRSMKPSTATRATGATYTWTLATPSATLQATPNATYQVWSTPSVDVQTTTPSEDTVQVWPTPRVDIRTYDGQVGKEVPR